MDDRGWQIWVIGMVGLWLVASPFALQFEAQVKSATLISIVVAGLMQMALAIGLITAPQTWQRWGLAVIGLIVFCLPWILGFDKAFYEFWDACLSGGVTFVLAIWSILEVNDYNVG